MTEPHNNYEKFPDFHLKHEKPAKPGFEFPDFEFPDFIEKSERSFKNSEIQEISPLGTSKLPTTRRG